MANLNSAMAHLGQAGKGGQPTTVTINQQTLAVGAKTFGPHNLPSGCTSINIDFDRTVSGGLNSLTSSDTLEMQWYISVNNGPFVFQGGALFNGGSIIDPDTGLPETDAFMEVSGIPGLTTSDRAQCVCTVVGSPIVVKGTLTLGFD